MDGGERSLVIVPTFNESGSIREVIDRAIQATDDSVDILVVDDGSPDGTADLVLRIAEGHPGRVHLLRRDSKQGLGRAYIAGFRWALARGYVAIVEMDADLSHDPAVIPRLLGALREAELALGSRYVPGGDVENWGRFRRTLSRWGNGYAGAMLRFGVRDSTSGFRAFRASALGGLDLDRIRSEGYAFQIETVRRIDRAGGRIVEIPITFVERATGRSKMSRRIVAEALLWVTLWGIRDRLSPR